MWRWSAAEMAAEIRSKSVSSVEVVTSVLARAHETNGATNAFGEFMDDALSSAERADKSLAAGDVRGPLHGVPFASKLNTNLIGLPTPDGVEAYLSTPAFETSPVLTNILDGGSINIARSNVPPFSTRWTTESVHWGITRNPWDPDVTPGGSSGGAASAVAVGATPFAQGNDIGGSVRYPAAVCGIVGLRTTVGRVPSWFGSEATGDGLASQQMSSDGPLARTVEDLRLALQVMSRFDPRDPASLDVPAPSSLRPAARRVALIIDPGESEFSTLPQPECADAVRTAGQWFVDEGYDVDEVVMPEFGQMATNWWRLALTEFDQGGMVEEIKRVGDEGINSYISVTLEAYRRAFGEISFRDYLAAHQRRHFLMRRMSEFFEEFPLVILPASGERPFRLGEDIESPERAAQMMRNQWPNMGTAGFGLPGVGIGVMATAGAPIGVQVLARPFDETLALTGAEVIERRNGIVTPIDPRLHQS
ncbi:MAG: amidase [Pseudolysinimonas sp.]